MSANGIDRRHSKWPLGLSVMVKTEAGYLRGKINKHSRKERHACWVEFPQTVTMRVRGWGRWHQRCKCCLRTGEPSARYCHVIPFRNIYPIPGQARNVVPRYRKDGWTKPTRKAMRKAA